MSAPAPFRPALAIALLALGACGSGGQDAPAPPPSAAKAEGSYAGSITRRITINPSFVATNDLRLVVLEDDSFWALYGFDDAGTGSHFPAGFVTGRGASANGAFSAAGVTDYGFTAPPVGTLSAQYQAGRSISGTGADDAGTLEFTATGMTAPAHEYARAASLAEAQGSWSARDLRWNPTTLDIDAAGVVRGDTAGCSFAGTLVPRASGRNVFDAALTFGAAPCVIPGQTSRGIAIVTTLPDGRHRILIAGVIPAGTFGTLIGGSR